MEENSAAPDVPIDVEDDDIMVGPQPPPSDDTDSERPSGEPHSATEDDDEGEEEHHQAMMAHLYQMLLARGYVPRGEADADAGPPVLPSFDVAGVAAHLRDNACSNVIVMCGAGISVSAGIPDFRSPGTGLYDNLAKYNLPTPQSVFDKEYFLERPDAFYLLCRELWPDNYAPTPAHHFVALLHEKGILRRCFTQNIDSLEAAAGLPADMVVAAHGNFDGAHVITEAPGQGPRVDISEVRAAVRAGKEGPDGWLELARRHGGLVKPDIVFFGEQLPERFFNLAEDDFGACDLLIVMGTSLRVQPFASLVGRVPQNCPRLLINREEVGQANPMLENLGLRDPSALDFSEFNTRDAAYLGDCDGGVRALAAALGWGTELEARIDAAAPAAAAAAAARAAAAAEAAAEAEAMAAARAAAAAAQQAAAEQALADADTRRLSSDSAAEALERAPSSDVFGTFTAGLSPPPPHSPLSPPPKRRPPPGASPDAGPSLAVDGEGPTGLGLLPPSAADAAAAAAAQASAAAPAPP